MIFILLAVIFHASAGILIKYSALSMESYSLSNIITNYLYYASLSFFFLQALSWQFALKKYDLHNAYIYMSIYYPLILLASYFLFDEKITVGNIAGIILIMGGLSLRQSGNGK